MTDKKIESYIERNAGPERRAKGTIKALKPGYDEIPYYWFSKYIDYGLYEGEAYMLGDLYMRGTEKEKRWVEDVLTDINFHTECELLLEGKYEEYRDCIKKAWA